VSRADYWTAARRRTAAERGHALPDGSWPIATVADLRNAIQAFGRAQSPARVARHIVARARALGHVGLVPDHIRRLT